MSALSSQQFFVSPAEYLEGEEHADCKHEYLNGVVYAMAGGTFRHSRIAIKVVSALDRRLAGKRCRPTNSDMSIRVAYGKDERFYYPDAAVVCSPIRDDAHFAENPSVIFEVLSPSTARYDNGEKKDAYLRCESLQAYVIVHSERVEVTIYTRIGDGWDVVVYNELTDTLPLPCIECELPLAAIYEE